jgi:transglycosylase-like protein with SLT domain/sporulation related protein
MRHARLPWPSVMRCAAAIALLGAIVALPAPAPAEPPAERPSVDAICRTLAEAAADNELPEEFFTRLIWQESRFDPTAVSPAGARGIAQFMPQTAAARGLIDAFEPLAALRESASYLRELRTTFRGSLGLAAAAYNAGPAQVEGWLAGRRTLPYETQAYVRIVTGFPAEAWASKTPPVFEAPAAPLDDSQRGARCVELAKLMLESSHRRLALTSSPAWGPWGVQLAGNWSEGGVLAAYERLRRRFSAVLGERLPLVMYGRRGSGSTFVVRVSEKSRSDADVLCARLRAAGGACIVVRNPGG